MNLDATRTYTGFGLGAIQAGLFLFEAMRAGNFNRLVVAEVVPEVVSRVRENHGYLMVNIACEDHVEAVPVGPVEIYNPAVAADQQELVAAVSCSAEIGTAVPATRYYASAGPESLCRILAAGLRLKTEREGSRAVLYAAENHNHAAEILEDLVRAEMPPAVRGSLGGRIQFVNTVIGKMSGVVTGRAEIERLNLAPMTPGSERAFLVEAFNRILISRISFPDAQRTPAFERGIAIFTEKDDLLPFEEAKLYGHNATHALAAYLGDLLGIQRIADIPSFPSLFGFLRRAFIEESGLALIHRYQGLDPLFTLQGYSEYADDLLARMVNPWLTDTTERVGRDVERKLNWEDRLVGTIRLGLSEGISPRRYALGAAAALTRLDRGLLTNTSDPAGHLVPIWGSSRRDAAQECMVLEHIRQALDHLRSWQLTTPGDIEALLAGLS